MTEGAIDPATLAMQLMAIDSTSGREGALVAFLYEWLSARRWRVELIPVSPGRDNILATAVTKVEITLSTHLDTVPPFIPPRLDETRLWGRGACDAKGIAAAMIAAGEVLRARGVPVALLFVVGEEVSHDGAHAANRHHTTSRILINGEPTESVLASGTKGALRVTLRTLGRAAHSAYPESGRSAVHDLIRLLAELDSVRWPADPVLGQTTVNVGIIRGGVADNVLAPSAEASVMFRIVSPPDDMRARLERWVAGRAAIEVGASMPPVHLTTVTGFDTTVLAYTTDIPALSSWGEPYLFGPGSIHQAHGDEEHVELEELRAAVGHYVNLAVKALARAP